MVVGKSWGWRWERAPLSPLTLRAGVAGIFFCFLSRIIVLRGIVPHIALYFLGIVGVVPMVAVNDDTGAGGEHH